MTIKWTLPGALSRRLIVEHWDGLGPHEQRDATEADLHLAGFVPVAKLQAAESKLSALQAEHAHLVESIAKIAALAEATGKCVLHNVREDYRYAPELRGNAGYLLAAVSQWRLRQSRQSAQPSPSGGAMADCSAWREAIENALGVEPDPAEHTPSWAYKRVLTAREIGNGVRNESGPIEPAKESARLPGGGCCSTRGCAVGYAHYGPCRVMFQREPAKEPAKGGHDSPGAGDSSVQSPPAEPDWNALIPWNALLPQVADGTRCTMCGDTSGTCIRYHLAGLPVPPEPAKEPAKAGDGGEARVSFERLAADTPEPESTLLAGSWSAAGFAAIASEDDDDEERDPVNGQLVSATVGTPTREPARAGDGKSPPADRFSEYDHIHALQRLAALSRIVRRALACHQWEKLEDARAYLDIEPSPPVAEPGREYVSRAELVVALNVYEREGGQLPLHLWLADRLEKRE